MVAIATCIILNFYYLEEVWSLKITPKCYCFHFSDLITKRRNSHSIPNPQKVKVSIKFWKLQTIFKTFKPKEKVLDGFKHSWGAANLKLSKTFAMGLKVPKTIRVFWKVTIWIKISKFLMFMFWKSRDMRQKCEFSKFKNVNNKEFLKWVLNG